MLEFVDWFIDKCGNNVSRSDYIEGYDANGNTEKVFREKKRVRAKKCIFFENRESFSKKSFKISLGNGRYLQAWCWRSNRFS